ncbi:hypothetical protein MMC11_006149 [Xylographa trunciseda]|nr:hypothetical protein [Xylographa trunciseda]
MNDGTTKDRDTSINASAGSESGVRKFTLSCSRCRVSKLKCDTKEPCMECVKRNVGHLCLKDERQPRAKRAKTDHNNNSNIKTNGSPTQDIGAEEAAQVLEHFVNGTPRTNAFLSASFEPTSPFVVPDYPNVYWSTTNDPHRQSEKLALISEIVDALPELDMIHQLYDVFVTRCQGPLGNIVHTPTFMKEAENFCGCLSLASPETQVMALASTISMDVLAVHLLALVLALAFHPTPSLLCWSPTPLTFRVEELRASDVHSKTWRSLALRCLRGGVSLFCGSTASLKAAIMLLLDGQEGSLALDAILVTAISGAQRLGLHRLGDARLEAPASPTSSPEDGSPTSTEPPHIRTEIGIRIWWALVMRDWSRGQALGYYSIHPSQFNTRMPLHINDDDLCITTSKVNVPGHITERPRSEFTMLSYTVHALEIADFARESIDLRGPLRQTQRQDEKIESVEMRNHLNRKYENFVAGLPSHFRLGSTVGLTSTGPGPMAAIPIQRWMLHQQLWSLFLRLHRASLSSPDGRASCQLLAQNIISTQAQIQGRCAICGSLSTSETQLFNAASVLLIDLLFSSKHKDADCSSALLGRLMTRDKIREAIELLRTRSHVEGSTFPQDRQSERVNASAQRSVMVLEALMKLEDEESGSTEESIEATWRGNRLGGQGVTSDNNVRKSLKNKVIGILEAIHENDKTAAVATEKANFTAFNAPDMSLSLPTATGEFQDLDVLPVLFDDPSCNFWQFLDFAPPQFPPEDDYAFASVDSQSRVSSMSFGPSLGVAHSNGFGTPEFANVYSNTDGTPVTYTSSSFMGSGPTMLSGGSEPATTPSSVDAHLAAKFS